MTRSSPGRGGGPPPKAVVEGEPPRAPRPAASPLHRPSDGSPPRPGEEFALADPERALATSYAPAKARPALTALFALDERLGGIVATTSEPTIGLIRLAWWREALERLDGAPAPAEPLLRALATEVLPRGVPGTELAAIEDGWCALLDGEMDAEAITRHGRARGGRLFACAAALLGPYLHPELVSGSIPPCAPCSGDGWMLKQVQHDDGVEAAGRGWALADLAHRHSSADVRAEARRQARAALAEAPRRWPVALRPLGALVALARIDAACEARRQGSPRRLLRMLALRLTGR